MAWLAMRLGAGVVFLALGVLLSCSATAQRTAQSMRRPPTTSAVETLNAWTVGLAGGQLEGAPIRFAAEIARVVDDGENLHVLPVVTRGPSENVEALLYLRGIDAAIINADALEQFRSLVPNIQQRIQYVLSSTFRISRGEAQSLHESF
jgi:hypothetical protein